MTISQCNDSRVESNEGILPKDVQVRHEILDTAASSAGANPEKPRKQLTAYFCTAIAQKEIEGSEGSQTGKNGVFWYLHHK